MFDVDNFFHSDIFGDTSQIYLESKKKTEKEWFNNRPQRYIGEVLYGNIHRHGFYFVENGKKLFYDGLFYSNQLEGYAQVFFEDGSHFQGLFKNNVRFGPGVLTYQDGQQDVGLWDQCHLYRLGGLNEDNWIPRLAETAIGQLKLLKFRYLVPICPKREDAAYNILQKLGANEETLKKSNQLYNVDVGNKRSVFFNKNLFDDEFYDNQDCCIDVVVSDEEEEDANEDLNVTKEEGTDLSESALGKLDINMERVKQISEGLEIIERQLSSVKKERAVLQEKVAYCRACCPYQELNGENEEFQGGEWDPEDIDDISVGIPELENRKPSRVKSELEDVLKSMSGVSGLSGLSILDSIKSKLSETETDMKLNTSVDLMMGTFLELKFPNEQIDEYLRETCECEEELQTENLAEMEKQLEKAMKEEVFLDCIKKNLTTKLQEHLRKFDEKTEVRTRKMLVKEVISWNNDRCCVRMLQHSFLHRKSEYMVNFKVSDIIAGNRSKFEIPGPHERRCLKFFNACATGNKKTIFELVNGGHLDPNVSDAKGNTGMFFAAINCQTEIIKTLVNLGAKLDPENDEGLLPLNMCLLIYIAQMLHIESWEKAFLPDEKPVSEPDTSCTWYPNASLLDLLGDCQRTKPVKASGEASYVFDTSYVNEVSGTELLDSSNPKSRVLITDRVMEDSITSLLHLGSDPNLCGVPLPALFLSLFTRNPRLVEQILEAGANINGTIENDMSVLHVVASLKCTPENINIGRSLICYSPDASLRTSTNHWLEQKAFLLGEDINPDDIPDFGKNALHILCIRKDFPLDTCSYFTKMVSILAESNVDFNTKYLGHTPLSLAVLVGNKNLVQTLINLSYLDPYQLLDHDMGNVLTVYILKRYRNRLPPNAKEILTYLVNEGVNPLHNVGGHFENAIAFLDKEHEHKEKKDKNKKPGKREKEEKKKGGGSKKPEKFKEKGGKGKPVEQKALIDYMRVLGRETIIKYIQLQAVENLYNLIQDELTEHECIKMLAQFLTPSIAFTNLQLIFKYGRIHHERFDKSVCLKLIEIVETNSQVPSSSKTTNYSIMLDLADFRKLKGVMKSRHLPPGLDNLSNYKVCYHCLRNRDKQLMLCPKCQYVYFCSEACNTANLKLKTLHACNLSFYTSEQEEIKSTAPEELKYLAELYSRTRDNCEERLRKRLKEGLELERTFIANEIKADIYGLKWLKKKKLTLGKTPTVASLYGSRELTMKTTQESLIERLSRSSLYVNKNTNKERRRSSAIRHLANSEDQKAGGREKQLKKKDVCECVESVRDKDCGRKAKCKTDTVDTETINKMVLKRTAETITVTKKLRKVPRKYQEFIELLSKYFPDVDFSSLFLPYACYSNGHLYYKFLEKDIFTKTYSMM